jgi:hypothetical protein
MQDSFTLRPPCTLTCPLWYSSYRRLGGPYKAPASARNRTPVCQFTRLQCWQALATVSVGQSVSGTAQVDKVGFEVLTAVSMKMAVFWVVAPCSLVEDLWNVGKLLPDYRVLQPRRQPSSSGQRSCRLLKQCFTPLNTSLGIPAVALHHPAHIAHTCGWLRQCHTELPNHSYYLYRRLNRQGMLQH